MTGLGDLGRLALSRGTIDRATERRSDPAWLAAAWADPGTRVLIVDGGRALVRFAEGQAELVFVPPAQAPAGVRFLLGVEAGRTVYFGVAAALE